MAFEYQFLGNAEDWSVTLADVLSALPPTIDPSKFLWSIEYWDTIGNPFWGSTDQEQEDLFHSLPHGITLSVDWWKLQEIAKDNELAELYMSGTYGEQKLFLKYVDQCLWIVTTDNPDLETVFRDRFGAHWVDSREV